MLKTIEKGTPFSRTFRVNTEEQTVHASFAVKTENDAPVAHALDMIFDYSECSDEEILILASQQVRVKVQSLWRKAKDRLTDGAWDNRTIDVAEICRSRSAAKDIVTKTSDFLSAMSDADREEFFRRNGLSVSESEEQTDA